MLISYFINIYPTLGEWGWVLGMNAKKIEPTALKEQLSRLDFAGIETRFLNQDAMISMLNFGKGVLEGLDGIEVNEELNLALFQYYRNGSWDLY